MDRKTIQRHIKASNLEVDFHEASYVKDVAKRIISFNYDCILLDNNLPDGTGLELLEDLSPEHKNKVPIILFTGGGEEFVVVLPGANEEGAAVFSEKIRQAIEGLEI